MKIIIVSHGRFAAGAKESMEMICGESDATVIGMDDNIQIFENEVSKLVDEEMIIFADIPGGHPFNTVYKQILSKQSKQLLVGGFNLPLLIETNVQANFKNIEELYEELNKNDISSIVIAKNWK